jgi:MFS family permease
MKSFSNSISTALIAFVILGQNLKLIFQTATPHLTVLCVGSIVSALAPLWFNTVEDLTAFILLLGLALIVPQALYTYHWYRFCLVGELPTLQAYLTPNAWRRRFVILNYLFFFLMAAGLMLLSLVLSPAALTVKLLFTGKPLDVFLTLFGTVGIILSFYIIRLLLNVLYIFPAIAAHKFASLRKAIALGHKQPIPFLTMLVLTTPYFLMLGLALLTTPPQAAPQTSIPTALLMGLISGLASLLIPLLYATGLSLLFKQTETSTPKQISKPKHTTNKKAPTKAKSARKPVTKTKSKKS